MNRKIWECSAGQGHLSERLTELGYEVRSTDLIDRGYGEGGIDFLQTTEMWDGDILTNPPYKYAIKKYPPRYVYVSRSRILCAKNGMFEEMKAGGGSAVAYAWYEFQKGYKGVSIIKWIN